MKFWPSLALNLAVVTAALFVYDQLRSSPQTAEEPPTLEVPPLPVLADSEEAPLDPTGEITDVDIQAFNRLRERADAIRREERLKEGMERQIARLGLEFEPAVRDAVIERMLEYRAEVREAWRTLPRGRDDDAREGRRKAFEALRDELEADLKPKVSAADLEKLIEGLGRASGFGGRER